MIVDPHLAISIDAVKLDKDRLSFHAQWHSECLAIPANATRQCTAASARRRLFTKLAFDTPVVWQIESSPLRIVQIHILSPGNIAELKAPILVE